MQREIKFIRIREFLRLRGQGSGEARKAARDILASLGLTDRLAHLPAQLSGGEQQRAAIARAFVVGPQLLLADEPTGNLDGATGETVIDLLFELQALHGATLCLITHDRALAARCAGGELALTCAYA